MGGRISLVLLFLLWPFPLRGQHPGPWSLGGSVAATLIVGDASDFLAGDFGAGVHAERRLQRGLAVRVDATYLNLRETTSEGARVDNRLLGLGLGPELSVTARRVGVILRPFAGVVGNFMGGDGTTSEGTDWTTAFGVAAGLRVHFGRLGIDLSGKIARMGELDFARASTWTGASSEDDLVALSLELGFVWALR